MAKKQPAETFRHQSGKDRNVSIAVWRNESKDGSKSWLAAGAPRLQYKDDDQWNDSTSFSVADLFALSCCVIDAAAFIHFEEMKEKRNLEHAA